MKINVLNEREKHRIKIKRLGESIKLDFLFFCEHEIRIFCSAQMVLLHKENFP